MSEVRPLVDPEAWAKQYDLVLEKRSCSVCGKDTKPIPVAFGDMRGFYYECADHPNHSAFSGSPVAGSEADSFWNGLFGRPPRPKKRRKAR
jgi:hypothetical protein